MLCARRAAKPADASLARSCPWPSMNQWDRVGCARRLEARVAPGRGRRCSGPSRWSPASRRRCSSRVTSTAPRGAGRHPMAKIVVAAVDLPLASKIKPEDLTLADWPADHLPAAPCAIRRSWSDAFCCPARSPGSRCWPGMLAAKNAGNGLAALIPPNMRAMAVRVDDVVGVAGFIHPDDRVDVHGDDDAAAAGRQDDHQGLHAEREGAGRRPGGRGQRSGAHARQPGHGGDAAGLAAGRPRSSRWPRRRGGCC